jgi:hypothetical protein
MKERILSFLLFIAILTLASCAQKTTVAETVTDTETIEQTSAEISDELPETDLKGWEMRVISHHDKLSDESTIYAAEMNGELINDLIYTRNSAVEERFNFKLSVIPGNGWADDYNKLKISALAGSHDYDMAFLLPFAASGNTVLDECLYNMLAVPHLNFDKPWWHTNVNDLFTYNGYLPFVSSDFLLSSYQYANILIYNKKMAEDFSLPNIYDTVREGKWTLDTFSELAKAVNGDLNGDGIIDENDRFAIATNFGYHAITWGYAIGEVSVKLDGDTVSLGYKDERFYNLCQWLYDLLYTSNEAFEIGWDKECDIKWDENRLLMQALWVNDLEKFRSATVDYGIIPYPKYDEEQDMYHTYVDARAGGCAIPIDAEAQTVDNVGLVLEALSCASYKDLVPAYLESVTNNKLTRDTDSIEMLEIISKGRFWDIGYTMSDSSSYTWIIYTDLKKTAGQVTSALEKKTSQTIKYYDKIIAAYKELSERSW